MVEVRVPPIFLGVERLRLSVSSRVEVRRLLIVFTWSGRSIRIAGDPLRPCPTKYAHPMSHNPFKRARLNPGAHRDLLPLPSELSSQSVEAREVRLVRVGGAQTVVQALPIRTTHLEQTSSWANLQTWEPIDDRNYALDPENGEWYDEAVDQDVTEEPRRPIIPTRKKYARSKVAVRFFCIIL